MTHADEIDDPIEKLLQERADRDRRLVTMFTDRISSLESQHQEDVLRITESDKRITDLAEVGQSQESLLYDVNILNEELSAKILVLEERVKSEEIRAEKAEIRAEKTEIRAEKAEQQCKEMEDSLNVLQSRYDKDMAALKHQMEKKTVEIEELKERMEGFVSFVRKL
jgi:chromosome segregation ATPase